MRSRLQVLVALDLFLFMTTMIRLVGSFRVPIFVSLPSRRSVATTTHLWGNVHRDAHGRRLRSRRSQDHSNNPSKNDDDSINNNIGLEWDASPSRQPRGKWDDGARTTLPSTSARKSYQQPSNFDDDNDDDDWYEDDRGSYNNNNRNKNNDSWGQSSRRNSNSRDYRTRGRTDDRQRTRRGDRGPTTQQPDWKALKQEQNKNRMDLKELEQQFDHLYGLAPVLNALESRMRELFQHDDDTNKNPNNHWTDQPPNKERTPLRSQFRPALFVHRTSTEKNERGNRILLLAEQLGLPVQYVDKGILNTLSHNRPHQNFVLRCGKLNFQKYTPEAFLDKHSFGLVLDEIVDPQNLGAILRSASFLECDFVLVCSKNSAPPSATVSAASAGALESMAHIIYETSSLPSTLAKLEAAEVRIVGASAHVPSEFDHVPCYDLHESARPGPEQPPTLLVLGSEGRGIRHSVARSCTEFVKIPGGEGSSVDSLNVSVTNGILLWHYLQSQRQK